jgi:hypothetical protein
MHSLSLQHSLSLGGSRQRGDGVVGLRAPAGRRGVSQRRGSRSDCMCHNISPPRPFDALIVCEPFKE